jgi:triacylglycerol lipase
MDAGASFAYRGRPMSFVTELPEEFYARDAFSGFSPRGVYSVVNARAMMWASQLAYEGLSQKIENIRSLWKFTSAQRIFGGISTRVALQDTAAIILASPEAVVIAFSGTDPVKLANWVTNFTLDLPPEATHRGFQAAADAIWADLRRLLDAALAAHPAASLFFAGHSLGGALSVLVAEKAVQENRDVAAIYTFGMPRVGTKAFQDRYAPLAARTYRLRFGQDFVPGVPTPELGYCHVGRYLHCPSGKFADLGQPGSQQSDEPRLINDVRDQVARFLTGGGPIRLPFPTGLRMLLPRRLGPAPSVRPDLFAVALEQLPPPLRDHVPHRYLGAL